MEFVGPVFWLAVIAGGALLLLAALMYGTAQWRKRSRDPLTKAAASEAVRRNYEEPPGA